MKKLVIIPLLLVLVFVCTLQAAEKDDSEATPVATPKPTAVAFTDRIDFTAAAGEFTQAAGATAPVQAAASQGEEKEDSGAGVLGAMLKGGLKKGKQTKSSAVVPEEPQAMGFTFDLMSIPRSTIDPVDIDLSFALVFGDYGNFGLEAIYYLQFLSSGDYFGSTIGLDLAFDIFPLGNSPAGFYLGPVLGGRMYIMGDNIEGGLALGANTGYRFNLGGFIIDAGIIYDAIITFDPKIVSPINDFQFQLSIGGFFQQTTPEMVKANKQGDKK